MKKRFRASNIDYVFEITRGTEIVFYLDNNLTDELGFELSSTRTTNSVKNPIALFREVRELLLAYVLNNKLNYFCFKGSPDRFSLYSKFADSLRKHGFENIVHEGMFSFYRVQK